MIRHLTAGLFAAVVFLAVPMTAQAQGLLDLGRVILGLPTEQKEPIDYRERAPLVVPPGQNLRQPQDAVPADQRRANWPQDPDVLARRRAAEEARTPRSTESVTRRDDEPSRRLTPAEIRAGRIAGAEVPRTPSASVTPDRTGVESNQNIFGGLALLRDMDRRDAANAGQAAALGRAEPPREFLTDPPAGIRRPADGAAFRATREGKVGTRDDPSPFDIFRQSPNTR